MSNPFGGIGAICVSENLGRCTQTSLLSRLIAHLSVMLNLFNFVQFAHARHSSSKFGSALAQSQMSASVRGDVLEMARCEILKQVQDDICVLTAHRSPLTAHRSPLISVPLKILYKTEFSYKSSWKVESAQLENFYFPVGKLFFSSWKVKISQ
ncbi:MAG: hypothetical protein IKU85_05570 [Bacteroidaceae bacterium]|nr:hypothetical protein [Bacteroidaceae bacterium]